MAERVLGLVDGGWRHMVMRPNAEGDGAEVLAVRPDDLPAFGLESPVALSMANLAALDRSLQGAGFQRGGTYTMPELMAVSGLPYHVIDRWLREGLIPAPPGLGHGQKRSFGYLTLLAAALCGALRTAGGAPDAVLGLVGAFLANPRAWTPGRRPDPKKPARAPLAGK